MANSTRVHCSAWLVLTLFLKFPNTLRGVRRSDHVQLASRQTETRLADIVRRHQAHVWRFLRVLGAGSAEADDYTQDAFLILLNRMRLGEFEDLSDAATLGFLRRSARNRYLQSRQAAHRSYLELRAAYMEELFASRPGGVNDDRLEALRGCIEKLSPQARKVVRLFYHEGVGRAEIAGTLKMKETGIKTLLQRTRASLRECMEREES